MRAVIVIVIHVTDEEAGAQIEDVKGIEDITVVIAMGGREGGGHTDLLCVFLPLLEYFLKNTPQISVVPPQILLVTLKPPSKNLQTQERLLPKTLEF